MMCKGLNWSIGRNGLFIEPDVEYIEDYKKDGTVIAGIYTKIRNGGFNIVSDFEKASGRKHSSLDIYFESL